MFQPMSLGFSTASIVASFSAEHRPEAEFFFGAKHFVALRLIEMGIERKNPFRLSRCRVASSDSNWAVQLKLRPNHSQGLGPS